MSVEWYDMIARKNGGYKSNAIYTVKGPSGEDVFEERLKAMLPEFKIILDAGCGHGEFIIKMAKLFPNSTFIGLDNSRELLKIAEEIKKQYALDNVHFTQASTKEGLPFEDDKFDLIYNRRGPTSILEHSRILRSGGTIVGIHSAEKERVLTRMEENGFIDIAIEEFDDAYLYFPNEREFAKYLSASHGSIDYTIPENESELNRLVKENMRDGRISWKQWRYIWKAKKGIGGNNNV